MTSSVNPAQDQPRDKGGRFGTKNHTEPDGGALTDGTLAQKAKTAFEQLEAVENEMRRVRDVSDRMSLADAIEQAHLDPRWTIEFVTQPYSRWADTFEVSCGAVFDSKGNPRGPLDYMAYPGRQTGSSQYTAWDDFMVERFDGERVISVGKVLDWARAQG